MNIAYNILIYNKIHSQQTLNKRKWLLKWKGKTVIPLRPCFSFRICLLGDMLLLRDCLGCILQYIRMLSVHFNSSTFLWLPASPPEYGMANYTNITCYFGEMMKRYINIKNNSNLYPHQTLNKRIGLMKREHGCNPTHHFSFGERLMKRWWRFILLAVSVLDCQIINLSDFHPLSSPLWKR